MGCVSSTQGRYSEKPSSQIHFDIRRGKDNFSASDVLQSALSSHSNCPTSPNAKQKPLVHTRREQKLAIALHSYEDSDKGYLCFKKGEKLIILDDRDPDWWLAQRLQTQETGYIPMNFVVSHIIEMEDKVLKKEIEKLLLFDDYPRETFIISNGVQGLGAFSLSLQDLDLFKLDKIKHYKVSDKNHGEYYITCRRPIAKLSELVTHYSQSSNCLACDLMKPCYKSGRSVEPLVCGYEFDRNDLELKREIGTGDFGKVYYGLFRGQVEVAVKTSKPGTMTPSEFLEEAAIMKRCKHKQLVTIYGVCSIGRPLLIITEYMCNGSILDYLRDNPEGKACTLMNLINMVAQISSGMAYFETMKIVHRNLAARNVLVGENKIVKVADFRLVRIIDQDEYIAQAEERISIRWTAPEAVINGIFTIKSDVWSFGVLLYELVTRGQKPYPGMTNRDVIEQVERGYRMPKPVHVECPDSVYEVMLACWQKDPKKRPTFENLYSYFGTDVMHDDTEVKTD